MYDVAWGTDTIRLLVLNQIPAADRNAILNLFSAEPQRIAVGISRFRRDPHELSIVLEELLRKYHGEPDMPQTLAEMIHDLEARVEKRVIANIPASRLVAELPLEKLQEAKLLIERRLAKSAKKKSTLPRATKVRRKSATSSD